MEQQQQDAENNLSWVIQQENERRAHQLNPYGEQPHEYAVQSAEYESQWNFPSYKDFPSDAKVLVQADLLKMVQIIQRLDAQPSVFRYQIEDTIKQALNDIPPREHFTRYQKVWKLHDNVATRIDPQNVWGSAEYFQLRNILLQKLKELACKGMLIPDQFNWGKHVFEDVLSRNEITGRYKDLQKMNLEASTVQFGERLLFHGLCAEAFLDVLENSALLCRKKQERVRGKARLNTQKNKSEKQEMYNVSFADDPDRGYTAKLDPDRNPFFSTGTPEDIWIVSDLSWHVRNGQRFFYSDGWQMMGNAKNEGYALSFENDPVLIMMTEKSFASVMKRLQRDSRDAVRGQEQWVRDHVIIIPERLFSNSSSSFQLEEEYQEKIRAKLYELHGAKAVSPMNGRIFPSGELYDDQSGTPVMSFVFQVDRK